MPSKGQPAQRRGGRMVGRSRDKATSVCNTRPKERTMGDIEAADHDAHEHTRVDTHMPLSSIF